MRIGTTTIIRRELALRSVSALSAAMIIACAVCMVLLAKDFAEASEAATRRIQRDIGLNIVILPPTTDLDGWWVDRMPQGSMPEAWIDRLEDQDVANRLVPMLLARVEVGDAEAILTGIAEERFKRGKSMKPVFGRTIGAGRVMLGAVVADSAGVAEGERVEISGRRLEVSRVLEPTGSDDDVRAWVDLAEAQSMLGLEGRINEIRALECQCSEDVEDPMAEIRAQLEPLVPGARIVRMNALADARQAQRRMAERFIEYALTPVVMLAGAIVGVLIILNVRDRRREMGVLIAHGCSRPSVWWTIMARTLLIALVGGALGWLFASLAADPIIRTITGSPAVNAFSIELLITCLLLTPLCASLMSFYPALIASMVDPARLMRTP